MKNATVITSVFFAAISLFLGGCATTSSQIADGTYSSPLHNFSVPIPDTLGIEVQEEGFTDGGAIAFHDDLGSLKSIFYLYVSPETLKTHNDPIKQRAMLLSFLDDFAMPNLFKRASADANILYREFLNVGDYTAYFAIVEIPGGSTIFDVSANKKLDTKRGLLIFVNGEFIYMLSSGENPSVLELEEPAKPLEKLVEHEKERLLLFKSSIIFK